MLKRFITLTCLLGLGNAAAAEPAVLSGQEIRGLISGATVEIDTPIGTKLPVRYTQDGQLFGRAGDLAFYLGAPTDTGRWWVTSDQLCHKWTSWFNSEPQCLRLQKEGRKIRWWNRDGNTGTAMIAVPAVEMAVAAPRGQAQARIETAETKVLPTPSPSRDPQPAAETSATADEPSWPAEGARSVQSFVSAAPVTQSASPQPKPSSPRQEAPKPAAEPVYMVANVEYDDVLNVRTGPSTEFDVIGELEPGSRGVTITGPCRAGWCPVQHQTTKGWVNRIYLASYEPLSLTASQRASLPIETIEPNAARATSRDAANAPRACLTPPTRALLQRVEERFGPMRVISTCRPGATIAGTGRISRHASGNAVDFDAGNRKAEVVEWLIANHHEGGTMTYANMDHIHIDIGPPFVSIAGGQHWASWYQDAGH